MIYLVSACLLGENCKYNGGNNHNEKVIQFCCDAEDKGYVVIPVCPELMGGLEAPRLPCEIIQGTGMDVLKGKAPVRNSGGEDVTAPFVLGAEKVLALAKGAILGQGDQAFPDEIGTEEMKTQTVAILKAKSPSCGGGAIYDGTFSHIIKEGDGVTAAILKQNGIKVFTEDDLS